MTKRIYEGTEAHRYASLPRINYVENLLSGVKSSLILDLGCGDGSIARRIGSIVSADEVFGADILREAVEKANSLGVKCFQIDLNKDVLPFDDEYFDLCIALELIEHLIDPDVFIKEVKRVMKPNGIFLLSTPNLASWMNRILLLFGYQPWATEVSTSDSRFGKRFKGQQRPVGHLRLFTLNAFRDFATFHGLRIIQANGVNFLQHGFLGLIDSIVSRCPSLASILVLLLEKK